MVRTKTRELGRVARHRVHFAAKFHGQPGGNQRSRVLRSFDHHHAHRHARDDAIANRKILRPRERAHGEFGNYRAAFFHLREDFFVLLGIDHIDPAAEHADRRTGRRSQGTFMRAGIDAPREPTDDDQTAIGQIPGQFLRHLIPVGRRTTRTHDRNQMTVQKFNVSAHIEERRRIVNFAQALRILGFVPGEQPNTGGLGLGQFFRGSAQRLPGMERLRYRGGQALRFQFGQRGVENRVRAAHLPQQLSGHACAQARRQRERQPSQVLFGVHPAWGEPTRMLQNLSSYPRVIDTIGDRPAGYRAVFTRLSRFGSGLRRPGTV